MITIEKNRTRWIAIAVAVGGLAAAAAWLGAGDTPEPDASGATAGGGLWASWTSPANAPASGAAQGAPLLSDAGGAQGVSAEELAALESALGKHPNAKAEAQRIVSYVRYHRDFEAWQTLDDQKEARQRRLMAERLLNELPDRLKSGEFTMLEAALMGAVLTAEVEPDPARRDKMVEAWQAKLVSLVPGFDDETRMAQLNRETEYMRRRATAYGEWQAKTDPADRTPAKLAQAMEEVQRAYNAGQ